MKLLILTMTITLFPLFGPGYSEASNHSIIRPFGFPSRQPPSTQSVKIIDFKMGLEAQQVCGYTDWTTASLTVPKHLLSKQYWNKVGDKIVRQAKNVILEISGALPGMLACNASPSWCNILNKNQMLAAFESQLTFDSCKMLEGVANSDHLQATSLKNCIQKQTSLDPSITPGQAREICLVNPNDSDGATSKRDKIAQSSGQGSGSFSMAKLLGDLFPDKIKSNTGTTIPLDSGGKIYSRRSETLRLAKELFPGIEIDGTATVVTGGTFQPTVEQELAKEMNELEIAIVHAMKEMLKFRDKGFSPKDIIAKTAPIWTNKSKWKQKRKPHPFYRATVDGVTPSFLVTPEQVLVLLPLADRTKTNLMTDELRQIIDRISRSIATIKVTDRISDLYTRTLDVCKKSPKYQDALAQKNCDLILQRTKASLEIVHLTRENEEKARLAQSEVSEMIQNIQKERVKKSFSSLNEKTKPNNSRMKMPWE